MRFLCLDVGDKRTGMAVGDDETGVVSPAGMVVAAIDGPLLDRLALAIDEHGPDELVVGLPINMDGSHGPRAKAIAAFADRLAARTGRTIHLRDERLSTFAADQAMARSGLTHKQKKARRDALAAAAILQGFLDERMGATRPPATNGGDGSELF